MSEQQHRNWDYTPFLQKFLQQGYEFVFFTVISRPEGQVALRHDIDFDTHFALQCAQQERALGIRSTFFFLMRSHFYNIFSLEDYSNIVAIKEMGHKISIHFDPTVYEDFHAGLAKEVQVFETLFGEKVDIISLHRPNDFFQQYDEPIMNIEHTYQSKYFRNIKYFADSTGVWRFGHPADSQEFAEKRSLHVLIHPVWWMVPGGDNLAKLKTYFGDRVQHLNQQFSLNCIPFRQINDQV